MARPAASTRDWSHRANLPRPLHAAAPLLLLAVAALGLAGAPELPWQVAVVIAALFAVAACVRLCQQWWALRKLRAVADRLIQRHGVHQPISPLIAWRTSELTSRRHRHSLATEARRLVHDLDAATLPGAVPLNRAAVRPFRAELGSLADVLDAPEPVSARGVLLAEQLLSDPSSPLYDRDRADALAVTLRRTLSAITD